MSANRTLPPPPYQAEMGSRSWREWFQRLFAIQRNRLYVISSASNPTTSQILDGEWGIWNNTSTNTLRLWANVSGTLKSVTLT